MRGKHTFNRTSVELKQYYFISINDFKFTFNRTSVELKPVQMQSTASGVKLLIEPVWN